MITHCQICKKAFWSDGAIQLLFDPRYCQDCAIKACEKMEEIRIALVRCKHEVEGMRIWNGLGWTYNSPHAKLIFEITKDALVCMAKIEE